MVGWGTSPFNIPKVRSHGEWVSRRGRGEHTQSVRRGERRGACSEDERMTLNDA